VALTTWPDLMKFLNRDGQKRGIIGAPTSGWWQRALSEEWPGVEFELPA
jgi:hypothetical protein